MLRNVRKENHLMRWTKQDRDWGERLPILEEEVLRELRYGDERDAISSSMLLIWIFQKKQVPIG